MSEVNLWKALSHEQIGKLLDSLSIAGAKASDIERIITSPVAARAAVLSAREAVAPPVQDPQTVPYTTHQLRRILETARVPIEAINHYSDPERFTRLINKPRSRVTLRGVEFLAIIAGASNAYNNHLTMQVLADEKKLTRERVRQIISQSSSGIRMLIEFDRPPIVQQVDQGRLSEPMIELLGLLG